MDKKLKDIKAGREKTLTAQVLKNLYTLPYTVHATPTAFLTYHEKFVPPNYVLDPNVHLISIEKEVAKFLEVDASLDILNLRKNPIFHFSQTANVKRIIVMQLSDFRTLLDSLEDDNRPVVWMFHTIRCGSTVWSQIFNALPNWSVLSEPQTMFYNMMSVRTETNDLQLQQVFESSEYEEWLVAIIKMYLRLLPKENHVFWKEHGAMTDQIIPIIHRRFSHHKIMLAYRDVLPNAMSFYKAFGHLPRFLNYVKHIYDDIRDMNLGGDARFGRLFYTNGYNPTLCSKAIIKSNLQPNAFEWSTLLWATKVRMFRQFKDEGIEIKCVKYDSIRDRPEKIIAEVFEYLDIPSEYVEHGLESLKLDSQDGLFFSWKNRAANETWRMTDECTKRCNILLREMGIDGDMNSITYL